MEYCRQFLSFFFFFFFFFFFLICFSSSSLSSACNTSDYFHVSHAFKFLKGFNFTTMINCTTTAQEPITGIDLSSKNLTGPISWMYLTSLSNLQKLDLSNNSVQGSIPGDFWTFSHLVDLNLAGNQLGGIIGFTSSNFDAIDQHPMEKLNLSYNRFTYAASFTPFRRLQSLDLSHNRINGDSVLLNVFQLPSLSFVSVSDNNIGALPTRLFVGNSTSTSLRHVDMHSCNLTGSNIKPLSSLRYLTYLDVSDNQLAGSFPDDFPLMQQLKQLNISFNNFHGTVEPDLLKKFGAAAFLKSGLHIDSKLPPLPAPNPSSPIKPRPPSPQPRPPIAKQKWPNMIVGIALAVVFGIVGVFGIIMIVLRRWKKELVPEEDLDTGPAALPPSREDKSSSSSITAPISPFSWVALVPEPISSIPVLLFKKPLLVVTFADLLAATSHFSKESEISPTAYRAILNEGDLDVVIRVLEQARNVPDWDMKLKIEFFKQINHKNTLPLFGYCFAGREKLLLYEFMRNGNLHQWIHELPAGDTNVEDWSMDTWEVEQQKEREEINSEAGSGSPPKPESMGWITRHQISLGIARGMAYLHHGMSKPIYHGRLNLHNILLDDKFEPLISDYGMRYLVDCDQLPPANGLLRSRSTHWWPESPTAENDVYCFGVVLLELLSGRVGTSETVNWIRGLYKEKSMFKAIDPRLMKGMRSGNVVRQVLECFEVAYFCTSTDVKKRPSMKQVIGMLIQAVNLAA